MSTANAPEQGLEKLAAKPAELLRTSDEYRIARKDWTTKNYAIMAGFTNFSGIPPGYALQYTFVVIDLNIAAGDVYANVPWLKKDEFALAKPSLRRLAGGMGISTRTFRTDDRSIQFLWEFKAIAMFRSLDGSPEFREATQEWDLRDGSPRIKGWTPSQLEEARKHGLRNCESRAINAVIREFGVKQKYAKTELQRPFVTLKVMVTPNMADPVIAREVTLQALRGQAALYPQPGVPMEAAQPMEPDLPETDTPRRPKPVGSGATAPAARGAQPDEPEPDDDDQPATDDDAL